MTDEKPETGPQVVGSTRPDPSVPCWGRLLLSPSLALVDRKRAGPQPCDLCHSSDRDQASLSPKGTARVPEGRLRGKLDLRQIRPVGSAGWAFVNKSAWLYFKPCYVPGLPVFPKKPLVLVFVMMDLLKRLLFKGPKLFSNQKLKRDFVPREMTLTHGVSFPKGCSCRNILASVAGQ